MFEHSSHGHRLVYTYVYRKMTVRDYLEYVACDNHSHGDARVKALVSA